MTIELTTRAALRRATVAALLTIMLPTPALPEAPNGACACTSEGAAEGFYALATITDAQDWQARWDTPPEVAPEFPSPEGALFLGETGHLLVFFANAAMQDGEVELICDFRMARPNGKVTEGGPLSCGKGPIEGPPRNLRLTTLRIEIEVEASDPSGLWQFDIGVTDAVRGVRVPLSLSFPVDATRERPAE